MVLSYPNKKSVAEILAQTVPATLSRIEEKKLRPNALIQGDNLAVMQTMRVEEALAGTIDLVYIDPPYATNSVFRGQAHISSSHDDELAYADTLTGTAYLEFLRERLVLIRELMADHASIYLHIDCKVGHYVKIVMDEIFGAQNFRNEITRIKCNPKNFSRRAFGNIKDMILFYTKSGEFVWNEARHKKNDEEVNRLFKKVSRDGRRYTTIPLHAPGETKRGKTGEAWRGMLPPKGRHWRQAPETFEVLDKAGLIEWSATGNPRKIIYADDAAASKMQDVWEFKDPPKPLYPTEKNMEMLSLIIETSSNAGDTVLDCFAGSGSTLMAADRLGRKWIGIDQSELSIRTIQSRFNQKDGALFEPVKTFSSFVQQESKDEMTSTR